MLFHIRLYGRGGGGGWVLFSKKTKHEKSPEKLKLKENVSLLEAIEYSFSETVTTLLA